MYNVSTWLKKKKNHGLYTPIVRGEGGVSAIHGLRNAGSVCKCGCRTGAAVVQPGQAAGQVRRGPAERGAHRPEGVPGLFAVPGHGPGQDARVRQVRGAAGAAVAVRRHRAGPLRGGGPRTGVPGHGHRGAVRRVDRERAGRVPRVRVRRDVVRQVVRAAVQRVRAGHRAPDRRQDGGQADRMARRGRAAGGRRDRVPRRRHQRPLLLRGGGPRRVRPRLVRVRLLSRGRQVAAAGARGTKVPGTPRGR